MLHDFNSLENVESEQAFLIDTITTGKVVSGSANGEEGRRNTKVPTYCIHTCETSGVRTLTNSFPTTSASIRMGFWRDWEDSLSYGGGDNTVKINVVTPLGPPPAGRPTRTPPSGILETEPRTWGVPNPTHYHRYGQLQLSAENYCS